MPISIILKNSYPRLEPELQPKFLLWLFTSSRCGQSTHLTLEGSDNIIYVLKPE